MQLRKKLHIKQPEKYSAPLAHALFGFAMQIRMRKKHDAPIHFRQCTELQRQLFEQNSLVHGLSLVKTLFHYGRFIATYHPTDHIGWARMSDRAMELLTECVMTQDKISPDQPGLYVGPLADAFEDLGKASQESTPCITEEGISAAWIGSCEAFRTSVALRRQLGGPNQDLLLAGTLDRLHTTLHQCNRREQANQVLDERLALLRPLKDRDVHTNSLLIDALVDLTESLDPGGTEWRAAMDERASCLRWLHVQDPTKWRTRLLETLECLSAHSYKMGELPARFRYDEEARKLWPEAPDVVDLKSEKTVRRRILSWFGSHEPLLVQKASVAV